MLQASPVHFHADDPSEIIDPAIKGTLGVMRSALEHGEDVKRIIYISSVQAIWDVSVDKPTVFTEKDWNEQAIRVVKEKGKDADGESKYGMHFLPHFCLCIILTTR